MPSEPEAPAGTVDDDLLRRALEAGDPLRGRELLPFTLTPAEMRAEVECRMEARPDKRSRGGK